MICPECHNENKPNARKCQCGFNFQTYRLEQPGMSDEKKRIVAYLFIGGILVLIEIIIFYF